MLLCDLKQNMTLWHFYIFRLELWFIQSPGQCDKDFLSSKGITSWYTSWEPFTAYIVSTPFTMEDSNTTEFPATHTYNITCYDPDLVPRLRDTHPMLYLNVQVFDIYLSGAFIIFGLLGNIVSFHILHSTKSSASFILKALAVADSLYLLIRIVLAYGSIWRALHDRHGDNVVTYSIYRVCLRPLARMVETISTWLIVLVTVGRYLAVKKPVRASVIFTEKKVKLAISLICVFSICLYMPWFFEVEFVEIFDRVDCRLELGFTATRLYGNNMYFLIYHVIIAGSVQFIIPLTVLIVLNSMLAIGIRKAQKQRSVMMADVITSGQRQSDSITAMVVTVVIIFVICQAPYVVLVLDICLNRLDAPVEILPGMIRHYLIRVAYFLLILNSSVNFIIYVAVGKTFRQKLFRCCRRRSSDSLHV